MPPRVKKAVNFTPISELDALNAQDDALEAQPAPKHDEDDAVGKAVKQEIVEEAKAIIPPLPPCALDGAPINSKVVVVLADGKRKPILMGPRGESVLAINDVAWTLPVGAKISKDGESKFTARQLDHNRDMKPLVCPTARDAISQFHHHFHG